MNKILLLTFFILFAGFWGCSIQNENDEIKPIINFVKANPSIIYIDESTELTCDISEGSDPLIQWSSPEGIFEQGNTGSPVKWRAPVEPGNYMIYVEVQDGSYSVFDSIGVFVNATNPDTIIEQSFILGSSDVSITMVWITAGTFMMGAPGTAGAGDDEAPKHTVTISEGYWIGQFEITQKQWEAVMGPKVFTFAGYPNRPADNISWNDAKSFITTLNQLEQKNLWRLPTEAEWEYACRAGVYNTRFWWGDDFSYTEVNKYAWTSVNSGGRTHDVGSTTGGVPNPWGLWDMGGNVWEWSEDWYHWGYIDAPGDGSAWIDPAGTKRIIRGGSFWEDGRRPLPTLRSLAPPSARSATLGVRIVREKE